MGQPGNTIEVTPLFGNANRFVEWDSSDNTIKVRRKRTDENDVSVYPMMLNLTDNTALNDVNLNQTYKDYARRTYIFTLTVYRRANFNGVPLPPEL